MAFSNLNQHWHTVSSKINNQTRWKWRQLEPSFLRYDWLFRKDWNVEILRYGKKTFCRKFWPVVTTFYVWNERNNDSRSDSWITPQAKHICWHHAPDHGRTVEFCSGAYNLKNSPTNRLVLRISPINQTKRKKENDQIQCKLSSFFFQAKK